MIDRIQLTNIRTHVSTDLKLGRMNLLVGPNGCGKSTVLRALEDAPEIRDGMVRKGTPSFSVYVHEGPIKFGYESTAPEVGIQLRPVTDVRPAYLHLQASVLAQTGTPSAGVRIGRSGEGLASALVNLRLEHEDRYYAIESDLKALVPQLAKLRTTRKGGDQVIVDFQNAPGVLAKDVSQGTLILLGILTALHTHEAPNLLLLDDIEHGLHPRAQRELVDVLRRLQTERDDLQIVATSHSPYLVDAFTPEEVIVFALRPDGTTVCKHLSEHPEVERAMQVLSTGEFLSAEGEDWVLGG